MRKSKTFTAGAVLILGALAVPLLVQPAEAHPRPLPHSHRAKAGFQRKAVILAGKPRATATPVVIDGRVHGSLTLKVKPRSTEVWVNGAYRGVCDDYDGKPGPLNLLPGVHTLRLVRPDGIAAKREISVGPNKERDIRLDLR